jgi:hypothetical protein
MVEVRSKDSFSSDYSTKFFSQNVSTEKWAFVSEARTLYLSKGPQPRPSFQMQRGMSSESVRYLIINKHRRTIKHD